ncbi:MAG: Rsd/AlgQ family anti-sigma factor [Thiohalomonadales bacterium]
MSVDVSQINSDRRDESHDKLHTLIKTRTETLSLYNQIIGMRPFNPEDNLTLLLEELCEALVDYTASAHFQLYRFLDDGTERREAVQTIANEVYPEISKVTDFIIEFNDKYDGEKDSLILTNLDNDLSVLGEVLADRITNEDKIVAAFRAAKI